MIDVIDDTIPADVDVTILTLTLAYVNTHKADFIFYQTMLIMCIGLLDPQKFVHVHLLIK